MQIDVKENLTGWLVPIDFSNLPFEPKRLFVVKNKNAGDIRGNHAHVNEEHMLICLSGEIKITKQSKEGKTNIHLKANDFLHQKELEWLQLEFLDDQTSLLVLASEEYTEANYIRDYDVFMGMLKK